MRVLDLLEAIWLLVFIDFHTNNFLVLVHTDADSASKHVLAHSVDFSVLLFYL